MKQRIKEYLKIGILLFGIISILFSCQKEDDIVPEQTNTSSQESILKSVSYSDIPQIQNYIESISNRNTFEINSPSNNRSSEPDLIIGELQTDEIILVTKNAKTNYSFKLKSVQSNSDHLYTFFNLVVEERKYGLFSYIIEYRPTLDWV